MPRRDTLRHRAPRAVAAVIGLLLPLLAPAAGTAGAQATDQRALLSLRVNEAPQGEVLVIVRPGDVLVEPSALDRAGLRNYAGRRETIRDRQYVSLASLAPGIRFVFDEAALSLTVTASAQHFGSMLLNVSRPRPQYQFSRATSAFLNYGANWAGIAGAGAAVEAGVSFGWAVAQSTTSWDERTGFSRGLSNIVVDQPDRLRRWTLGDSLVRSEGLGSGMLIGGVRVARDYGLDPYFVQFPTLGLSGTALTPSTVDVYVNGSLVSRQTVAPGSFTLENLPMPNGRNDTRVVVRDAFGREQQMTAAFYLTTSALARGLHDYDYTVGFPRLGSTEDGWSYGRISAVARHRYGFTDRLTAGFTAEGDARGVAAGPTANLRLGLAEIELGASGSRRDGLTGAAAIAGIAHAGRTFNFNLRVRSMSSSFSTLAVGRREEPVRVEGAGLVGVVLFSRVSLAVQQAVSRTYRDARRSETSLFGTVRASRLANVFFNASRISEETGARISLHAGLTIPLGTATSASVWGETGSGRTGLAAEVQRPLPIGSGVGYRARAALGGSAQGEGTLEAQWRYGRYELGQGVINGASSTTASLAGGLVFIGGGVHPTRPVADSYALVRVPEVGGVRTYLNNQEVGRTNRRGDAIVPNLLPYYANRLAISDQDVPFDREIEAVEQAIAPPYRGGSLVTFPARRHQAVVGTLAITAGDQIVVPSLGEVTVTIDGRAYSSPIGAAGEFYFENLPTGDHVAIVVFKGGRCRVTLHVPPSATPVIRLGIVRGTGLDPDPVERQP